MNKKLIAITSIAMLLATIAPTFALQTQANAQAGDSDKPWILAKVEWIPSTYDDSSEYPWLQVNPSGTFGVPRTLQYVMVAKDPNGIGDLVPNTPQDSLAFADVYHPDGSWKYQVPYTTIYSCYDNVGQLATWIGYLQTATAKELVTFGPGTSITDVVNNLTQCSAKIFVGQADLDYCQMCGQFTWVHECEQCGTGPWEVDDFCTGYKVDGYVTDKSGAESDHMVNYFEYICEAGLEADFNKLDFESVRLTTHKWIEGDRTFDALGPACDLGTSCVAPTVRNIGNMPITGIGLLQDDMEFGYSGPLLTPNWTSNWNVKWDARIGEYLQPVVDYAPYQQATVLGDIDLCELDKISFSIYVKKIWPEVGLHEGTITLTPVTPEFPDWFTPLECGV